MLSGKEMAPREVNCSGYWVDAGNVGVGHGGLYNLFALEGFERPLGQVE